MTTSKPETPTKTLGDFFTNAWDILTAETVDDEEESYAVDPWNYKGTKSRHSSKEVLQSREPENQYDYIYYGEPSRGGREAPDPRYTRKSSKKNKLLDPSVYDEHGMRLKGEAREPPSKIDPAELPSTIAVVSQSPELKNRFMAEEYKEIRENMKQLLVIEEEDLHSVGLDNLQALEKKERDHPMSKRDEKVKAYAAARYKATQKKQKSPSTEKQRSKGGGSRKKVMESDRSSRSSRSSRSPREPTRRSLKQLHRKSTNARGIQDRSAPRGRMYDYDYPDEARDPVEYSSRYENRDSLHHYHRSHSRHMYEDEEICSQCASKRSSAVSLMSAKRFLGIKR